MYPPKGVAGDRGEQGPPGVNGFQVCVCFGSSLGTAHGST